MIQCPLCDYEAETRGSVRAHMQGKGDEDHRGIGFQKADQMLDAHGVEAEQSGSSPSKDESSSSTELDVPNEDTSEKSDDGGDDEYVCTECGGDLYDLREREHPADFACVECGTGFMEE